MTSVTTKSFVVVVPQNKEVEEEEDDNGMDISVNIYLPMCISLYLAQLPLSYDQYKQAFSKKAWDPDLFVHALSEATEPEDVKRLLFFVWYYTAFFLAMPEGTFLRQIGNRAASQNFRIHKPLPTCGRTTVYTQGATIADPPTFAATNVRVIFKDPVDLAAEEKVSSELYKRVAILKVGPTDITSIDWTNGHELSLRIRTTLETSLSDVQPDPNASVSCLYTEEVKEIRKGAECGYRFIASDCKSFDVVMMSLPEASQPHVEELLIAIREKCELAFNVCAQRRVETLIIDYNFEPHSDVIANAFCSVVELYAGRFCDVYFTSKVKSVMRTFALVLTGRVPDAERSSEVSVCPYKAYECNYDGPLVVASTRLPACKNGGKCNETDLKHYSQFEHPPFCYDKNCDRSEDSHMMFFSHERQCPDDGICALADNESHCRRFIHSKLNEQPQPPVQLTAQPQLQESGWWCIIS